MVSHCTEVTRIVDRAPLYLTAEFLDENKIDLVIHADDDRQEAFYRVPLDRGIMRYVPYTKGVSTTGLIERIRERGDALKRADGLARVDL
jgi:glycerol-3-phosphate cytidylyltransferase-like family protein